MKTTVLIVALIFAPLSMAFGQTYSVTVDVPNSEGGVVGSTLQTGRLITFPLRYTNAHWSSLVTGVSNGFQVYSTDGAEWTTTTFDTIFDETMSWGTKFDLDVGLFFNSITGSGADTVGIAATRESDSGLSPGFSRKVATITIGPIDTAHIGKTICLDSSYYPPAGTWAWSLDDGPLDQVPEWDGPHCYTITSYSIGLDHVDGAISADTIPTSELITFYVRYANGNPDHKVKGLTNGFQVYSTDGAEWSTTTIDTLPTLTWNTNFDLIKHFNSFGVTGSGADTVAFGASIIVGPGLPPSFDDTAIVIKIGPIDLAHDGKTICLDSSYYPPTGTWKWDFGSVVGSIAPNWDGPHCYTIQAPIEQTLIATPIAVTFNAMEGAAPSNQTLTINVSDTDNPLAFSLSHSQSWLGLSPESGTTPEDITVSADVSGLSVGTYHDTITVTAAGAVNSPLKVPCILNVDKALTAVPTWTVVGAIASEGNQAPPETLFVTATDGVSAVSFDVSTDSSWLTVTPTSGTTPETLIVVSDATYLPVNHDQPYISTITLTPSGGLVPTTAEYKLWVYAPPVGIRESTDSNLPTTYALSQNYPNPFNPNTQIAFDLPRKAHVTLDVYNVLGRKVATLVDKTLSQGSYVADWDGRSSGGQPIASGIYFYRLHTEQFTQTKKMVLLK